MRPADTWKDYELLDATDGNRLERWGETILIRPDPQVVWKTPKQSPLWAKADAVYHRSNQGGGEWEYKRRLPEKWKIHCGEEVFDIIMIAGSLFIIIDRYLSDRTGDGNRQSSGRIIISKQNISYCIPSFLARIRSGQQCVGILRCPDFIQRTTFNIDNDQWLPGSLQCIQ